MKKVYLVKKPILSALVILYDVVSLFWCYIILSSLVFAFSLVSPSQNSIGIIGGADLPTWSFIMGGVFGIAFSVLFVVLSLATTFLFTVSIFKKQTNRKFNILLCVFSALTLIIYMLIPMQTYVVSLYILVRKVSFLKYIQSIYVILSLIIIVTSILFTINRRSKTQ